MTLKDLAIHLNLSYSTVSAVMRGRHEELHISSATAARVRDAACELGYTPNLAARALRNNRSYSIGILLPSPRDSNYAVMVADIQDRFCDTEFTCISSFWESTDRIQDATENILRHNIEGLITNEPDYLPDDLKIPVVTYFYETPRFDHVCYLQEDVVQITLDYLASLGHSKIGIVSTKHSTRVDLFIDSLRERQMVLCGFCLMDSRRETILGLDDLLSDDDLPDALVANSDETALLAIQHVKKHGLSVPEDISVMGCDDSWIAKLGSPPLTSICRTDRPFGTILAETLLKRMQHPELPRMKVVTTQKLVERSSCAKKYDNKYLIRTD
jgi:DNA-binding LacI/PurR family transcriptional regulator